MRIAATAPPLQSHQAHGFAHDRHHRAHRREDRGDRSAAASTQDRAMHSGMGTGNLGAGAPPTAPHRTTCKARVPRPALPARRAATSQVHRSNCTAQHTHGPAHVLQTSARFSVCGWSGSFSIDSPGVPRAAGDGRRQGRGLASSRRAVLDQASPQRLRAHHRGDPPKPGAVVPSHRDELRRRAHRRGDRRERGDRPTRRQDHWQDQGAHADWDLEAGAPTRKRARPAPRASHCHAY